MKSRSIRPLLPLISAFTLTTATAELQIGVGAGAFSGSKYDESTGYGLEGEIGFLNTTTPVNLFLGVRGSYVDGLQGKGTILNSDDEADLDLFEGALVARLLVPLGNDMFKLYGEGSAGAANLKVSGRTGVDGKIGGQDFSFNSNFDEKDWVLAWGLGAGVQFDFTPNFGLRIGYNYHNFGESSVFGLNIDPGSMHGFTSALIFKF
jgi:opacity protein-like surface antigen